MTQALQLVALMAASVAILYKTPHHYFAKYLALVLAIYLTLQLASLYMSGSFINYQFYTHLNFGDLAPYAFQFATETVLLTLSLALVWLFFHKTSVYLKKNHSIQLGYVIPLVLILFAVMSEPFGILRESYGVYKIVSVEKKAFSKALNDLGINPEHYPTPDTIHATKGKNIIVISMESLEKGFVGDMFNTITPNLTKLSEQLSYYDMATIIGGEWTSASLYNHQTGMPALFNGQGSSYFQGINHVKLTGLGHVLSKAGYNSAYIMGNAQHGGSNDLLTAYKIPVVSEYNTLGNFPETRVGLNDFDLFEEAKLQILRAKNTEEPFALFLSTINTHFPSGIYDERMKGKVGDIGDGLEFSVAALDYLIGDFFDFLAGENLLSNTAIFIFPDHLLMGSGRETSVLRKLREKERGLFLISNVKEDKLDLKLDQPLTKLDLPRLILNGADIKTNARFLTDFVGSQNTVSYIAENQMKLAALNYASITRDKVLDEITVTSKDAYWSISAIKRELALRVPGPIARLFFDVTPAPGMHTTSSLVRMDLAIESPKKTSVDQKASDVNRFIAHAGGSVGGNTYTNSLDALNHSYKRGFRLFELDIIQTSDNQYVAAHDWNTWKKMSKFEGKLPPTNEEFLAHKLEGKYTPLDMSAINYWFGHHSDAILITDKINDPKSFSAAFIDKSRLMMELFSLSALRAGLQARISSAMPTWRLLSSIEGNVVETLQGMGITDIAASRRVIDSESELLKALAEAGIHVYAFHINHNLGKNESYVVCTELDYFYGLYADNWSFDHKLHCD